MKYKFIVLDKENNVTIKSTKSIDTLYKTCGYRKDTDFIKLNTWEDIVINESTLSVSLWGKSGGKSNNVNNSVFIKQIISKPVYGTVVFVFEDESDVYPDIDMGTWENFKEHFAAVPPVECSESDYTFDNDNDNDNEEIVNCNSADDDSIDYEHSNCNELTYEPYYISSDDE